MWCLRGTQHRAASSPVGRKGGSATPRAIPTASALQRAQQQQQQQQQQRRQQQRPHAARRGVATAAAEAAAAAVASWLPSSASDAKSELRRLLEGSGRGFRVGRYQRGMIEEAQVNVEGYAPQEIDFQLLEGKWRLLYTTAADVVRRRCVHMQRVREAGDAVGKGKGWCRWGCSHGWKGRARPT
eukprot:353651-Chlamydomonas_euryale.AAC.8